MSRVLTITTPVGALLCHCGSRKWRPAPDWLIQCVRCKTHYQRPEGTRK